MKAIAISVMLWAAVTVVSHGQTYSIRHNFSAADAQIPNELTFSEGKLYGTTRGPVQGTCFCVDEDGSNFRILHSFTGPADGSIPMDGLLRIGNELYGTTVGGGAAGKGTIFSVGLDGSSYSILKSFVAGIAAGNYYTNEDGVAPEASLIASGSRLFGTAHFGGHCSAGTVFSIATDGTAFTVLHHFTGGADGANPQGRLLLLGDRLYGMARDGGDHGTGTIFSLSPDGAEFSVLHAFAAAQYANYTKFTNSDGSAPMGTLISDGTWLYGVAPSGGVFGNGTVFRLMPDGTGFHTIKQFSPDTITGTGPQPNPDGSMPLGRLLLDGNRLYGTTYYGGAEGFGTVYTLKPDGSEFSVLHSFTPSADGYCVKAGLVISGNTLYGTTGCGGANREGILFALTLVPSFLSVTASGAGLGFTCNVIPGRLHSIEFTTNSSSGQWSSLGEPFSATNSRYQVFDASAADRQRFYRIKLWP